MRVSSAIFTIASGIAAVSAADCAAAGDYDSQGRYSCNPAHQYPNGQSCKTIDGCPLLADASGQPIYKSTCAAPGDYDDKGRYSCNPAHQYPNGQSCKTVEGCPLLVDANGQPIVKATGTSTGTGTVTVTSSAAAQPTSTGTPSSKCAAPGDYDSKGRYSCNPAHQYPNGQTCKVIDNCPLLCDASGKPIVKATGTGSGNNGKPTDLPIVGAGSVLTGGMAMVAAAVVAAI
ncbi:uncharacterized protein BBA_08480 [Beauveria bassiana ARSEF 2860]|uniref:Vacuole-localized protein 4 n=1 Tax=Beauveria bassiana (strain ARSEF 2860) TaxID=655819 RepID=VLP4_BEAB2|nr:uncharacterized protein BBA_08480 [Beauveria bassiana ARSEF 2860]J4KLP6.1 RecName: Full=Vacuole-localized protein 4; Flags: Precursor [Beauveria bassiana ARSEF 2860]EJP62569.1 hypothetical protein BBA_08480 [Beauveria bassiana ARSEF 2860]